MRYNMVDINYTVWDYYKHDTDPLYTPYEKVIDKDGCPINKNALYHNPLSNRECSSGNTLIHPEYVRKGWGLRFQRKFGHYPCPHGYVDVGNGYCEPSVPESKNGIFYTKDAFTPKNQYFADINPSDKKCVVESSTAPEFEDYSINPFNGMRDVSQYRPKGCNRNYKIQSTPMSYLV